ncbi:MAG: hypothetical protein RQ728_07445 [Brevefilum sp.]|nr:hypothetical protein [Brevefilum sp.]
MEDFISDLTPKIYLNVFCGSFPENIHQEIIFETNISWRFGRLGHKWVISYPEVSAHQLGIFNRDFSNGNIYVSNENGDENHFIFPLSYPMGELLMINLLGLDRGIMLHASGVIYKGEGYLFPGQGGAGKSTIARLWNQLPGVEAINDDKVILRKMGDTYFIYGTPWHGEGGLALPQSAPLKQIFLIEKSEHNYISALSQTQSIIRIMNGAFLPLWDQQKMDFTLGFLSDLTKDISVQELGFVPDKSIIDFILNLPIN